MKRAGRLVAAAMLTWSGCGIPGAMGQLPRMGDSLARVETELQGTNKGLGATVNGLGKMEQKLTSMGQQLRATNQRIGEMGAALGRLEQMVASMDRQLGTDLNRMARAVDSTRAGLSRMQHGLEGMSGKLGDTNRVLGQVAGQLVRTNSGMQSLRREMKGVGGSVVAALDPMVDRKAATTARQVTPALVVVGVGVLTALLLWSALLFRTLFRLGAALQQIQHNTAQQEASDSAVRGRAASSVR